MASLKDYPSLLYGPMSFDDQRRVAKMEFVRLVIKGGKLAVWPAGA